ncbi:MAG: phosphate signaling complex protein PhoU [Spirochaetales bacterium]|nr:phosphate signaling complex protein PhoU [Spirochaetales bacterium]
MPAREHYRQCLQEMYFNVLKLGTQVEAAVREALTGFLAQDVSVAEKILAGDEDINELQLSIEDQCVALIAREQPVARDLREIMTSIKVASNLERIGDHAVHLAKATKRLAGTPYHGTVATIREMGEQGAAMVHAALDAFMSQDGGKAREVAALDDGIDAMHDALIEELLRTMHESDEQVEMATSLLFVSRFLERLGDHVVNICEWIVYGAEGTHVELNG